MRVALLNARGSLSAWEVIAAQAKLGAATSAFFFTSSGIERYRQSSTVVFLDPCQPLP